LRDEMIKNGSESPEEVQWLWNEQIALLDALLRAES
uniref:PadR family transcriptional regulator n=1 Tax=Gongylonema pulchrum TaxID=637853 RepID=A0A183E4V7_9BILA